MGKFLNIRIFTKKLLIVTVRRNCLATLISSRTKLHTEEYLFQAIFVQAYLQKGEYTIGLKLDEAIILTRQNERRSKRDGF